MVATLSTSLPRFDRPAALQTTARQYLIVQAGSSAFAIELTAVREVLPLVDCQLTPVPNTLPMVMGLFNLRGEILVATDGGSGVASLKLDRTSAQSRIVVLEVPGTRPTDPPTRFGWGVSQVKGVMSLSPEQIVSAAELDTELARLLQGLVSWQGSVLMVLDPAALATLLGSEV